MCTYSFYFYRYTHLAVHTSCRLTKNETPLELKNKLIDGLILYLKQGYIDPWYINCDCEDEGSEEADRYLSKLDMIDKETSMYFRKKIVESTFIQNGLFKSFCLDSLLLSDTHSSCAINYLCENHSTLSLHPLKAAMFYLVCAKNDPSNDNDIPDELISGLKNRYKKITEEHEAPRYQGLSDHEIFSDSELLDLNTEYEAFCNAWT
ncbi:hypothetical protein QLZ26_14630 [Cronobacter universalis]|uniref:hypothetical protein n=1 Tax=Cronobacter universalis TaxID=535744 RepID=UPI0024AF7450|nr:hypothetical protein [Cronobacter universalis]MDI7661345.1 hypothetical protein [Cronobacter universalis]